MFNVGGGEFLIILLVALVVLGPTRLPEAARQIGKVLGDFRRMSASFQREMQSAMNDPVSKVTGTPTPKSISDVTKVAAPPADPVTPSTEQTPKADTQAEIGEGDDPPEAPMFGDR